MTRYRLIIVIVVLTVMGLTLRSVLQETHTDEQYGMARIRLTDQTVYVKSRKCNAGCNPGIWLTRSSDRCKAPDEAADYSLDAEQILFARQGNILMLLDDPHALIRPTGGDWINVKFVPQFSHAAGALPLQAIVFGQHLPTRDVPSEQVDLDSCVRAFGHNWNWL